MRERALSLGFRLEKVRGEDRYIVRYAINGNRAHHEFQDGTRAQLIGWLYGSKGR
jgi:hypothetical protein